MLQAWAETAAFKTNINTVRSDELQNELPDKLTNYITTLNITTVTARSKKTNVAQILYLQIANNHVYDHLSAGTMTGWTTISTALPLAGTTTFKNQDRQQCTTHDHTGNKESVWNTNNNNGTAQSTWDTQSNPTSTSQNLGLNNSPHLVSNPFNMSSCSCSGPAANTFDYVDVSEAPLKLKQLTGIAIIRPLLTQELNQWKVIHATIQQSQSTVPDSSPTDSKTHFMGMKQFSVFAWAKTHPKDKCFLTGLQL
jgi:hypothetical protein